VSDGYPPPSHSRGPGANLRCVPRVICKCLKRPDVIPSLRAHCRGRRPPPEARVSIRFSRPGSFPSAEGRTDVVSSRTVSVAFPAWLPRE
jgi:hypothetical protein